ncbi:MAG TPA: murein biosynthesis integral membrane protein MurJ [Streptosporangiaceae bacterium]|nr:murein biosynthesis integral membrane protein MurJ [Streptosporangiaceae bacterium]
MTTPASRAGRSAAEATGRHAGGRAAAGIPGPSELPAAGGIPPGPATDGSEGPSVVRSSGVMALGTLASRGTGFLRTLVLAYALGVGEVANAYNNANTLPNTVYDLMLGGILTSIVVPLLVNAAKRDADGGEAYDQRMFTLAAVALFVLTVVATLAASLLVGLYAHSITGPQRHLMVIFAYFFIPQIFFYGMSSLAGGVLNARGHFAAPMWTPILNNIVVIAVLLLFIITGGIGTTATSITAGQVQLLGFGTTLGIIVQTAALVPYLRRVGFRWRPRFDFRRAEVAEIRRMAGPLFGYIVTTQVAFLVVQNVANAASVHAPADGFSSYSYAWQLFQMPYAIIGISVITALLPRMSAHAADKRYLLVKADFSGGVRLSSVIVVPAALVLFVLGGPLAEALFGYGSTQVSEAHYIGLVFGIFSLGLVPYMMFQLMLRVFYAMHDSRTPMYIGVAVMAANIAASLLALAVLPTGHVVEGVAAAFGLANLVGAVAAWRILSRRLHGLAGRQIATSLTKMHLAAIPSLLFALATSFMVSVIVSPGPVYGIVTMILGGAGALLLYLLFARALGITEVTELTAGLRTRLRR